MLNVDFIHTNYGKWRIEKLEVDFREWLIVDESVAKGRLSRRF